MSVLRALSLSLSLLVIGSACGADPIAAPDSGALVDDSTAAGDPSALIDNEAAPLPNLFLPTVAEMPERLQLLTAGDLDGPTVQPAGNLVDGATWDGHLEMTLSLDNDLGWVQPLVDVSFSVAVDEIGSGEWRYLTSYSEASLTDLVDNSAAESPELVQELMASYANLSVVSTVDAFGLTSDSNVNGIDRLPVAYQLDIKDFAEQVSDLSTPVPAGELGVGAIWTDETVSDVFDESTAATYTYEIVAIDGPLYTIDFFFTAVPTAGDSLVAPVSSSGSIVAEVGKPIPLRSTFTITTVLPIGYGDLADPLAVIDVVLEGS